MSISPISSQNANNQINSVPRIVIDESERTSKYYQEYFAQEQCSPVITKNVTIPFKGRYTVIISKKPIEFDQFVEQKKSQEKRKRFLSLLFVAFVCACIAAAAIVLINKYIINMWR